MNLVPPKRSGPKSAAQTPAKPSERKKAPPKTNPVPQEAAETLQLIFQLK